jgi:hypothetical protein
MAPSFTASAAPVLVGPCRALAVPRTSEEILAAVRRAESGDRAALPVLRQALMMPGMLEALGLDPDRRLERSFIRAIAGSNLALGESIARKLDLMRTDLLGPAPSAAERLLVDRVVAGWLQAQHAEACCARAGGMPLLGMEFLERRANHAHRRYLSAIKALAQVRKLALPVLQVNIAEKQVNVAGGS